MTPPESPASTRQPTAARVRALCLALCGLLALPPTPWAQSTDAMRLPALGESASEDFSLGTEKRLGEQIMREIRRDPDYLDDAPLLDYLQSVWQPLVQAAHTRGDIGADTDRLFPYEPFLVRDRSVNAFALPGGYVGVHLALIAMTGSRDELASVLAHELSHITQRHIARSVSASSRSSMIGLAGMILAVLAASRSASIDVASAAITTGQAAMAQTQLNFSRDMEREADRNGIAVMSAAGFAPSGMAAMFEKLDAANRINDNGSYPYLRSHPLTSDRIGEAKARIETLPQGASGAPTLEHALMRARARVLMDPGTAAQRRMQELAQRGEDASLPPAERLGAYYAAALASLLLRDPAAASRDIHAAQTVLDGSGLRDAPAHRALSRLAIEAALARGEPAAAASALATLPADGSRADLLLRAQVALATGAAADLGTSGDALQVWVAEHRLDAGAWHLLSRHAALQGQTLRAVRAEAEAQAALGDLRGAIDRLRAGQQMAQRGGPGTSFIEASVIDARLRDLTAQRRTLQQDQARAGNRQPEPD